MASFLLTGISAAVGAFLSALLVKYLEHRISWSDGQESHRNIDQEQIEKLTLEIRDKAIQYWSSEYSPESSKVDEAAIIGRITSLSLVVDRVFGAHADLNQAVVLELNRFDSSITAGDFQVSGRKPNANKATDIEICAYALVDKVITCRRKLPRKFLRK